MNQIHSPLCSISNTFSSSITYKDNHICEKLRPKSMVKLKIETSFGKSGISLAVVTSVI